MVNGADCANTAGPARKVRTTTEQTRLLHIETTRGAAKRTNLTRYNWMEGSRLENKEIARVLEETADLMEIAGEDSNPVRAYRRGAKTVEGYPERIVDI